MFNIERRCASWEHIENSGHTMCMIANTAFTGMGQLQAVLTPIEAAVQFHSSLKSVMGKSLYIPVNQSSEHRIVLAKVALLCGIFRVSDGVPGNY